MKIWLRYLAVKNCSWVPQNYVLKRSEGSVRAGLAQRLPSIATRKSLNPPLQIRFPEGGERSKQRCHDMSVETDLTHDTGKYNTHLIVKNFHVPLIIFIKTGFKVLRNLGPLGWLILCRIITMTFIHELGNSE